MAFRIKLLLEIEDDTMSAPAGDVLDAVVTAAVNLLEKLNTELQNSPTDTVSGEVVRAEAQRLQDELDKVNAGTTPVPDPGTPDPTLPDESFATGQNSEV